MQAFISVTNTKQNTSAVARCLYLSWEDANGRKRSEQWPQWWNADRRICNEEWPQWSRRRRTHTQCAPCDVNQRYFACTSQHCCWVTSHQLLKHCTTEHGEHHSFASTYHLRKHQAFDMFQRIQTKEDLIALIRNIQGTPWPWIFPFVLLVFELLCKTFSHDPGIARIQLARWQRCVHKSWRIFDKSTRLTSTRHDSTC